MIDCEEQGIYKYCKSCWPCAHHSHHPAASWLFPSPSRTNPSPLLLPSPYSSSHPSSSSRLSLPCYTWPSPRPPAARASLPTFLVLVLACSLTFRSSPQPFLLRACSCFLFARVNYVQLSQWEDNGLWVATPCPMGQVRLWGWKDDVPLGVPSCPMGQVRFWEWKDDGPLGVPPYPMGHVRLWEWKDDWEGPEGFLVIHPSP